MGHKCPKTTSEGAQWNIFLGRSSSDGMIVTSNLALALTNSVWMAGQGLVSCEYFGQWPLLLGQ